jgi:hypothetical protein
MRLSPEEGVGVSEKSRRAMDIDSRQAEVAGWVGSISDE